MQAEAIPMPPLEVAIIAAKAMSKGKNIHQICEVVKEKVSADPSLADGAPMRFTHKDAPVSSQAPTEVTEQTAEQAEMEQYFKMRHYMAYLRLVTGQIQNLTLEEMEDCACVATMPGADFDTWMKRKGYRD